MTPMQQITRYLVIDMTISAKFGPAYKLTGRNRQGERIFRKLWNRERYRYRNEYCHINAHFNIKVDLVMDFFIFFRLLEVFTSVPPDPVPTVHCHRWVVFFSCQATAT